MDIRRRELIAGAAALLASPAVLPAEASLRRAARDACIFASPQVEIANVRTRLLASGVPAGRFVSRPTLSTPASRSVTTPNNDTLYAQAFIDLSKGPASLSLPALGGRYASLALMDMYSNNFAVLGTRTTGDDAGEFQLVGPAHQGQADAIRSPTPWVWALVRVLVDGPQDLDKAFAVTSGFVVKAAPSTTPAPGVARDAPWADYLKAVNALLLENPALATDRAALRRIAPLGLGLAGFDPARFDAAAATEIAAGLAEARAFVRLPPAGTRMQGGWSSQPADIGNFFQDYETRARVALRLLAALPMAEAMYLGALSPEGRHLFDGDGTWQLSFPKDRLPPVDSFWSLTMYEATPAGQFFLAPNAINRYAIGDRTPGLARNADGSLDIWVSRADPGGARSANWLPAPGTGPFSMILRAYLPRPQLLSGAYLPPPFVKI